MTKLIIISAVGFVVSALIFFFLIRTNLNQVSELYNIGIQKQTKLKSLSEQIIALRNSESDLNAVQNKEKILNSILERENLQVAIREIESAATLSTVEEGMTIQENLPNSGTAASKQVLAGNPDVVEVPYTINISGGFDSWVKFLQYTEHLPHFTEVSRINIGALTTNTDANGVAVHSGNLTGVINAVFFVRKPKP